MTNRTPAGSVTPSLRRHSNRYRDRKSVWTRLGPKGFGLLGLQAIPTMAHTYVGMDVAKHLHDRAIRDAADSDGLPHDQESIKALRDRLTVLAPDPIVRAATGGLEEPLAASLDRQVVPVDGMTARGTHDHATRGRCRPGRPKRTRWSPYRRLGKRIRRGCNNCVAGTGSGRSCPSTLK